MRRGLPHAFAGFSLALGLALACAAPARATGVGLALLPTLQNAHPGDTVTVGIDVPAAGGEFNAFNAAVHVDTTALKLLPSLASVGCLMTGGCSAACGSVFYPGLAVAGDSCSAFVSLLCNNITLTGPGRLFQLRFLVTGADETTTLHLSGVSVLDAGLYVTGVTTADAQVQIAAHVGVEPRHGPLAPRLRLSPSPARGDVSLGIETATDGPLRVDVLDVGGRTVRHLADGWAAAGARTLRWDGAGEDGHRLPVGVYLVRLRTAGAEAHARAILLQ